MAITVCLLIGTKKGLFIAESGGTRQTWTLRGPYCETWPINHAIGDPATGTIYATGGNEWFGPAVWKSTDLGESWTHSSAGLGYAAGETPVKSGWSLAVGRDALYCGVEPAGLFRSTDQGASWSHVAGLRQHPTRPQWQPGGGGLILHTILTHPIDAQKLWVGISSVGVFSTDNGGATWATRNRGVRADFLPEDQRYPDFGQCVHNMVLAPGQPDLLYQQNHCGMYRSTDGARTWQSMEAGLPSSFGFPVAVHPRDPATVYLVPLNGDTKGRYMPDAKTAVYRTNDGGQTWSAKRQGLPQSHAYYGVLRQAMAVDTLASAGVYFGTSTGQLYASADEGETWSEVAGHLPAVLSVETLVVAR